MELGSDFLLGSREQKLAQNPMILTQVQMCFSTEKHYEEKAGFKKKRNKKELEVYIAVSLFNARCGTEEGGRLHCIFKVVKHFNTVHLQQTT